MLQTMAKKTMLQPINPKTINPKTMLQTMAKKIMLQTIPELEIESKIIILVS
jgi:hypothetical protein